MKARFLAVFLAGYAVALGGDGEFDHVVKAIESHYGTKRTHVPFMGLASFAVKVAHPAGTSDFKLALFEDLRIRSERDETDLDHFMQTLYSSSLRPVVRAHSRRDGNATYIYMGDAGKSTRVLIAAFSGTDATVIEVKVDVNTLMKWLNDPDEAGKSFGTGHDY